MKRSPHILLLMLLTLCCSLQSTTLLAEEEEKTPTPDVVYVPTPNDVVAKMLQLAKVSKKDVVYDLGCGDGRIVVTAAEKFGCKGVGYDINPVRVKEANENIKKAGVGELVTIKQENIFDADLSPVSVVTLYLLPRLNVKLIPQLNKMKAGSRVVSHAYDMEGVKPDQVVTVKSKEDGANHLIYLWTIPLKMEEKKTE
jgi:protein-L-isoaspartate O-methyltransferase